MHKRPSSIIALFPRHIDRIPVWQQLLTGQGLKWTLRSALAHPIKQGTVVLWDRFGELVPAYALAGCAFVGGSLAPLGGQNFLEPLSQGVIPCIGPSWSNFFWVGPEIMEQGLLRRVHTAKALPEVLLQIMRTSPPRDTVRESFGEYIRTRQGGTHLSIEAMLPYVSKT